VWVVPTAGGEAREIVSTQDADRPRWAPDSKRFLFLSSKEGGSQIWIADFDDTKGTVTGTHKLTSIATEADGPLWSPDGKNILFVSNVYPECADEACNAKRLEEVQKSKVKALIFTHLLYRHWDKYMAGKRSHIFLVPVLPTGAVIAGQLPEPPRDLTPGDYDTPPFSIGGQDDYAFSPDGQEICYTSNHDKDEALSTNNDLFTVSVNGGAAKKITDNPAPLFAGWKVHRLSRSGASGIRKRSLPLDAIQPAQRTHPQFDGEFRSLGGNVYLGPGFLKDVFRRRGQGRFTRVFHRSGYRSHRRRCRK